MGSHVSKVVMAAVLNENLVSVLPEQLKNALKVAILIPKNFKLIRVVSNSLVNMGHDDELFMRLGSLKLFTEPSQLSLLQIGVIRNILHIVD